MSDFFGGILDSIRGNGDDANSFFGSTLSSAIGRGVASGGGYGLSAEAYDNARSKGITPAQFVTQRNKDLLETASSLSSLNNVGGDRETHSAEAPGYRPVDQKTKPAQSEDFENVEQAWIRRMMRFAQFDNVTGAKVNEKGA